MSKEVEDRLFGRASTNRSCICTTIHKGDHFKRESVKEPPKLIIKEPPKLIIKEEPLIEVSEKILKTDVCLSPISLSLQDED